MFSASHPINPASLNNYGIDETQAFIDGNLFRRKKALALVSRSAANPRRALGCHNLGA